MKIFALDTTRKKASIYIFDTEKNIDYRDWELLSRERESSWKVPFAKLSHKHSILQETSADFGCEHGISLDIFPIDYWNSNKVVGRLQAIYCGLLRRCMSASIEKSFYTKKKGIKRIILYFIWRSSRMVGTDFFRCLVEKEVAKKKKTKSCFAGCLVWTCYGKRELMPAEVFLDNITVQFEKQSYCAPCGTQYYLNSLYGNYMRDLPIEKQKTHHAFVIYKK